MLFYDFLKNKGKLRNFSKHEHIFMQGEENKNIFFVKKGLLKAYYLSEDGSEKIKSFFIEGDIIGSLSAAYLNKKCSFSLVPLENCEVLEIPFDEIISFSKSNNNFANEMIDILIKFSIKKEIREYEFLCLSAKERYFSLLKENNSIIDRVTKADMARYLGITPVALSRIRSKDS